MKTFFCWVLLSCWLSVGGGLDSPAHAGEPLLEMIRFEHSVQEEKVFLQLNGFYPPEVFAIKGEKPRMVCDFKNVRLSETIEKVTETKGNLILRIRVGIHTAPAPKTRVVLDLVPHKNYTIEQNFFQQDNTYVLSIRPKNPTQ